MTDAPVVTARAVLRQLAFVYLTGNGDAHAKNLSVHQLLGGEWRPTPAYDVPSSYPYGDTTMALTIDGKDREDITWRAFFALGRATGVPERAVRHAPLERSRGTAPGARATQKLPSANAGIVVGPQNRAPNRDLGLPSGATAPE